jgi:hypothetical protein
MASNRNLRDAVVNIHKKLNGASYGVNSVFLEETQQVVDILRKHDVINVRDTRTYSSNFPFLQQIYNYVRDRQGQEVTLKNIRKAIDVSKEVTKQTVAKLVNMCFISKCGKKSVKWVTDEDFYSESSSSSSSDDEEEEPTPVPYNEPENVESDETEELPPKKMPRIENDDDTYEYLLTDMTPADAYVLGSLIEVQRSHWHLARNPESARRMCISFAEIHHRSGIVEEYLERILKELVDLGKVTKIGDDYCPNYKH